MVSSGKVSCIVFVMHVEYLLLRVMCVLMDVHVLVGVSGNHSCMDTWKYMCIAHQPKNFKKENKSPLTLTKQTNTNTQEQDTGCPALRTGTVG